MSHAASLPGLWMPVAVAVLGLSLSQLKYVWSPSFLDPMISGGLAQV